MKKFRPIFLVLTKSDLWNRGSWVNQQTLEIESQRLGLQGAMETSATGGDKVDETFNEVLSIAYFDNKV